MKDVLIIGGGVIGLSLAYELARRGASVRVLDKGRPGREASWAGAGILPPGNLETAQNPYEALTALSHSLHPEWSERLREETGIDNGFRRTGALHLARTVEEQTDLAASINTWRERRIEVEEITASEAAQIEPALCRDASSSSSTNAGHQEILAAARVPDECQLRNPRHLKALLAACDRRGVVVEAGVAVEDFDLRAGRVTGVQTSSGVRTAGKFCLCSGAWSASIAAKLGIRLAVKPIRGQMVLLSADRPLISHIVNEGARYLVPRTDGRILVGSTEEDAGFASHPTPEGVRGLLDFALGLAPGLRVARFEMGWAGLRPGSADGLPYLGTLPGLANVFVATGHFRSGLQLSTGTAVVTSEVLLDSPLPINLGPFSPSRKPAGHA